MNDNSVSLFIQSWQQSPESLSKSLYTTAVLARLKNGQHFAFTQSMETLLLQDFKCDHNDYITVLQSVAMINTILLYLENKPSWWYDKRIIEKLQQLFIYIVDVFLDKNNNISEYRFLGDWIVLPHEITLLLESIQKILNDSTLKQWHFIFKSLPQNVIEQLKTRIGTIQLYQQKIQTTNKDIRKLLYFAEAVIPHVDDKEKLDYLKYQTEQSIRTNGTVGSNVEATAQHCQDTGDQLTLDYLKNVASHNEPKELFQEFVQLEPWETAWIAFYLIKADVDISQYLDLKHLETVFERQHIKDEGWPALTALPADCDTTTTILFVTDYLCLNTINSNSTCDIIEKWWDVDAKIYNTYFSTNRNFLFHISTNVHALLALLSDPRTNDMIKTEKWDGIISAIEKVCNLNFEAFNSGQPPVIHEPWHTSLIYPLSDVVYLVTSESSWKFFSNRPTDIVEKIVHHLCQIQNPLDGGFTYLKRYHSTMEETSFVVFSLIEYLTYYYKKHNNDNSNNSDQDNLTAIINTLLRAVQFLKNDPYKELENDSRLSKLWTSKVFYCPINIIHCIIVSALYSWDYFLQSFSHFQSDYKIIENTDSSNQQTTFQLEFMH